MKLLLDTHAFVWWHSEQAKLSPYARTLCQDPANTLLVSVATAWEIQIKVQAGKWTLDEPLTEIIRKQRANNFTVLPVELAHVFALERLPMPPTHKDPFD